MREKSDRPETGERHVRDIRRATRPKWSSEEKIRIVLSGVRRGVSESRAASWPGMSSLRQIANLFMAALRRPACSLEKSFVQPASYSSCNRHHP
jgi:hypothetical protein